MASRSRVKVEDILEIIDGDDSEIEDYEESDSDEDWHPDLQVFSCECFICRRKRSWSRYNCCFRVLNLSFDNKINIYNIVS